MYGGQYGEYAYWCKGEGEGELRQLCGHRNMNCIGVLTQDQQWSITLFVLMFIVFIIIVIQVQHQKSWQRWKELKQRSGYVVHILSAFGEIKSIEKNGWTYCQLLWQPLDMFSQQLYFCVLYVNAVVEFLEWDCSLFEGEFTILLKFSLFFFFCPYSLKRNEKHEKNVKNEMQKKRLRDNDGRKNGYEL